MSNYTSVYKSNSNKKNKRSFLCINGIYSSGEWQDVFCNYAKSLNPNNDYFGVKYQGNILKTMQDAHIDKVAGNIFNEKITDVVPHSYGCQLVRLAMLRYSNLKIKNLWLLAAADYSNFSIPNGYNELLSAGRIEKITCFTSYGDWILGNTWLVPTFWGQDLGYVGPKNASNKVYEYRNNKMNHFTWTEMNNGLPIITPIIVI